MTLKELSQLFYLENEVKENKKELKELKADSLHSTPNDLKQIEYLTNKIALDSSEIDRLKNYINKIQDSLTRQIFMLFFVRNLTWEEVSIRIPGNHSIDKLKKKCYRYIKNHK